MPRWVGEDAEGNLLYDTGAGVVPVPKAMMPGGMPYTGEPVEAFMRGRVRMSPERLTRERIEALQAAEGDFLARRATPFVGPPAPPVVSGASRAAPVARRAQEPPARRAPQVAAQPFAWETFMGSLGAGRK